MFSGMISWFYGTFVAPFPWASLVQGFFEIPYTLLQNLGL